MIRLLGVFVALVLLVSVVKTQAIRKKIKMWLKKDTLSAEVNSKELQSLNDLLNKTLTTPKIIISAAKFTLALKIFRQQQPMLNEL